MSDVDIERRWVMFLADLHKQTAAPPAMRFGSRAAALEWAGRLRENRDALEDHGFDLVAELVSDAADWLEAYAQRGDE